MSNTLSPSEARVLGVLVEKAQTTPGQYPMTVNAIVSGCNQKSNRDPVLHLEQFEITGCLMGLRQKGLVMIHEREGGRVQRYGAADESIRVSRCGIGSQRAVGSCARCVIRSAIGTSYTAGSSSARSGSCLACRNRATSRC